MMSLKSRLREKALELGFAAAGFTGVEPLDLYIEEYESRPPEMYHWTRKGTFDLLSGARLGVTHPEARSLLVLVRNYHRYRFPPSLAGRIGRFYQVDERMEKGSEYKRMENYLAFLKEEGIRARIDPAVPARMSAARAGLVTYGKNCFAYARGFMQEASWMEIHPILLDAAVEPDEPSIRYGCPSWCRNACMAACPTKALYAPGKMNPPRCIAYLSYYGEGITPREFREPMGVWIYGCDRCQQVCPRNDLYQSRELPVNEPLEARAGDFDPAALLVMSDEHYATRVWPLCFYISRNNKAKWQMNAARVLGNIGDRDSVPLLAKALADDPSDMVRGMCAWALGRIGGGQARNLLELRRGGEDGLVREEIDLALAEEG
jgi:epoxyqueuosine reductase